MPAMTSGQRRQLWSGFWATSLGTLASRVLGLLRDMATASLLGLGEGGTMDALVIAFRVPNLLRRIFGEGALAASFLPAFTRAWEDQPRRAWQLLSVMFVWLTIVLVAFTLLGEAICAVLWRTSDDAATLELVGLSAALLPYMIFICLAAQASAALQALSQFRWPAFSPVLLNVCWLAAIWLVAPRFAPDKLAQAYGIAVAVLISGLLQLAVLLPPLVRLGYRLDYDWSASRAAFWQVARAMVPITLGLAVTQLNTLMDSLIAWTLSAEAGGRQTVAWLGDAVYYPMQSGAAAAIYYGERFYQFPVGILGQAIATVIYPLLSRHEARDDRAQIGIDLTLGLRLVWFTALPASLGIILVAQPLARVLFERGAFTAEDAARASRMMACYAAGVWAYCAIPVLVRGYYAVGDRITPARLGLVAVAINFVLNLTLIWPLAENGLAIATAIAAGVQVVLMATTFSRTASPLEWHALNRTLLRCSVAGLTMSLVVLGLKHFALDSAEATRLRQAVELSLLIVAGMATYLGVAWLLGVDELRFLLGRRETKR
jgi:putative peptidoglycan lipid II flippase